MNEYSKWGSIEIDIPEYMIIDNKIRSSMTADGKITRIKEVPSIKLVPKDIKQAVIVNNSNNERDLERSDKNKPMPRLLKIKDEPILTQEQLYLREQNRREFIKERNKELQAIKQERAKQPRLPRQAREAIQRQPRQLRQQQQQQPQTVIRSNTSIDKKNFLIDNFESINITDILKKNDRLLYTQILNYVNKKIKNKQPILFTDVLKTQAWVRDKYSIKLYNKFAIKYIPQIAIRKILNSIIIIINTIINNRPSIFNTDITIDDINEFISTLNLPV